MDKGELVKRIKIICASKEVSIRQMEDDLGFSPGLISRWIKMSPSFEKIVAVADYLGVSLDFLLGREAEASSETFIERLCKATTESKLEWKPCGSVNPFSYPIYQLKVLQDTDLECGYCVFQEGFLLLACTFKEEQLEDINLYIIPNEGLKPTLQELDGAELLPLYELIKEKIIWNEDKELAEKLKENFMKNRG